MKSVLRTVSLIALFAPAFASLPNQDPAPAQAPKKEVRIYDEKADARADLAAALAQAKKDNQRVLIQWGANWCGWCVLLDGTMKSDKEIARELLYEYRVLHVDIGKWDKNLDLAKELGADFKATGVPLLTVLDADGKSLVHQNTSDLETQDEKNPGHDRAKVLAFLEQYEAKHLDAAAVRDAAFARAKAESKRVFLHFGAPWCGYCHMLEAWMARPEVAAILAKEFVDLKIDTDRMVGGADALKSMRATAGAADGGIPWIVFFDAEGKQLATGDRAGQNIGCPVTDEEIAHFVTMLQKSRVNLNEADISALSNSLVAARKENEARRAAKAPTAQH